MPSTGAWWRTRWRLLAAPLDKEEPRKPIYDVGWIFLTRRAPARLRAVLAARSFGKVSKPLHFDLRIHAKAYLLSLR
jgi:hypothetical protein